MELPKQSKRIKVFNKEATPLDGAKVFAHPKNLEWCRWIANFLEIEADGGDDPAEFVRWCFEEMYRQRLRESQKQREKWISEWQPGDS